MPRGRLPTSLRVNIHPTSQGAMVVVLHNVHNGAVHSASRLRQIPVDLGEPWDDEDRGALLMACSDALAAAAKDC
jgi:hypothetical protein